MELVIDREIWLRGENDSYLLRDSDDRRCCLGIYLEACGVDKEQLSNKQDPYDFARGYKLPMQTTWLMLGDHHNSDLAGQLMGANDDRNLLEEQREEEITFLFAKVGITVRFIN